MASSERSRLWWPLILAAVLALCALVLWRGVVKLSGLQEELAAARQSNARLDKENRALYRQVQRLRQDKTALERAARRDMGLVGDDEVVYTGPGKKAPAQRPPEK